MKQPEPKPAVPVKSPPLPTKPSTTDQTLPTKPSTTDQTLPTKPFYPLGEGSETEHD